MLVGHSSGANICALALLEFASAVTPKAVPKVDLFFGLAGVYDIDKHYLFEANRGVHLISPMAAAAGGVHHDFWRCSPTKLCQQILLTVSKGEETELLQPVLRHLSTRCVLIHGTEDSTVPHTSSEEFAEALISLGCDVHTDFIQVSYSFVELFPCTFVMLSYVNCM